MTRLKQQVYLETLYYLEMEMDNNVDDINNVIHRQVLKRLIREYEDMVTNNYDML